MKCKLKFLALIPFIYVPCAYGWWWCLGENQTRISNECSEVLTASPCHTFEAQFTALFLKPSTSNMHFAVQATPLPTLSPSWNIFDIHPHYHFGFDLAFKTICHHRNTNLMVNWERFESCKGAAQQVPLQDMVGPFFEIGPDAGLYKTARGQVKFHFDEVNLDYGQFVSIGKYLDINLFAGVSFVRIKQLLCSEFANLSGTVTRGIQVPSRFIGAGPQVGIDFSYNLMCGVNLAGKSVISLLAGTLKNHTTYSATSPLLAPAGFTAPNIQNTCVQNRSQLIPSFNEKLGISCEHIFCDYYEVKLEAGYQAQIYLNALQSIDIGSEVVTPPVIPDSVGVFARTFQRTLSNFALAGPYVSFFVAF